MDISGSRDCAGKLEPYLHTLFAVRLSIRDRGNRTRNPLLSPSSTFCPPRRAITFQRYNRSVKLFDDLKRLCAAKDEQLTAHYPPQHLGAALEPFDIPTRVSHIGEERTEVVVVRLTKRGITKGQEPVRRFQVVHDEAGGDVGNREGEHCG